MKMIPNSVFSPIEGGMWSLSRFIRENLKKYWFAQGKWRQERRVLYATDWHRTRID